MTIKVVELSLRLQQTGMVFATQPSHHYPSQISNSLSKQSASTGILERVRSRNLEEHRMVRECLNFSYKVSSLITYQSEGLHCGVIRFLRHIRLINSTFQLRCDKASQSLRSVFSSEESGVFFFRSAWSLIKSMSMTSRRALQNQ